MIQPTLKACAALLAVLACLPAHAEGDEFSSRRSRRHNWNYDFGAELIALKPQGDLKTAMADRTGLGIGAQWTSFRRDWWLSRKRLEWTVLPEAEPVGASQTRTHVKTFSFHWDQVVFFNDEPLGIYVVGGLGAIRWFVDETTPAAGHSWHTTKLGVTAGLGVRLANQVSLEGRYVVSSLRKSMDANTAQVVLGWHF